MMKFCFTCKKEKDISNFQKHSGTKDGFQSQCRECRTDKQRKHYSKNKEDYLERNKQRTERNRLYILEVKSKSVCECGENRIACLDFHHRNPKEKEGNITNNCGWSLEKLKREIEKCDVLCANCHRFFHWKEKQ